MLDDYIKASYEAFLAARPLFRIEDAIRWGLREHWLKAMWRNGAIRRAACGLYADSDYWPDPRETTMARFERHTVCLLSALWIHRLIDDEPKKVWYSLRPPARVPRDAAWLPARFVRIAGPAAEHDVIEVELHRRRVRVYSIAKTLADCLKFRRLVGEHTARDAYLRAVAESRIDHEAFAEAARICRVRAAAKPLLG
ncbi:MAG: type IV toxin-antitoxin system AbiEi family antitoxin domain-containing protein [Myxococcaceae bacterium]